MEIYRRLYSENDKKECEYTILDWYNINTKIYWNMVIIKILTDRDYESRKKEGIKRDNITSEYFDLREKIAIITMILCMIIKLILKI